MYLGLIIYAMWIKFKSHFGVFGKLITNHKNLIIFLNCTIDMNIDLEALKKTFLLLESAINEMKNKHILIIEYNGVLFQLFLSFS